MRKAFCLKRILPFLMLFCLFGLANAVIINESCEQFALGNGNYQLSCSTQPEYIKDINGAWQDFNKVVSFKFDSVKRYLISEWNGNYIILNPFGIISGKKVYLRDLPILQFNNLNFSLDSNSFKSRYQWGVSFVKIANLTAFGWDINSNLSLTEKDFNNAFFKFGSIGLSFSDFIEKKYSVSYSVIGNNLEIRVSVLTLSSNVFLEPSIVLKQNNWDAQSNRRTTCIEEIGCTDSFSCPGSTINPWRVGITGSATDYTYYRTYFEWTNLGLPSNAIISDVNVELQAITKTGHPEGRIYSVASKPSTKSCSTGTLFNLINGQTQYVVFNLWGAPVYWEKRDLTANADAHLQSHLDWFAVGIISNIRIIDNSDYVGLGNTIKFAGAKLNVIYSLKPITAIDDMVEPGLIRKNILWFPIAVLSFLGLFFVYIVLKD